MTYVDGECAVQMNTPSIEQRNQGTLVTRVGSDSSDVQACPRDVVIEEHRCMVVKGRSHTYIYTC